MNIINKTFDFLKQWIVRYLNNRNIMLNNIDTISEGNEAELSLDVKFKTKDQKYFLIGFLNENDFSKIKNEVQKDQYSAIVLFNTKDNLNFVVKNWSDLIKNRKLILMFLNPFSKTDKMWSVFPQTHDFVSEGKAIKEGLTTLFSNVEESTEQELRKIIESD